MLYDYRCPQGHKFEQHVQNRDEVVFCECGEPATRQFPASINTLIPMYMSAANDHNEASRSKQRDWIASDECRKQRDAGLTDALK